MAYSSVKKVNLNKPERHKLKWKGLSIGKKVNLSEPERQKFKWKDLLQ